MIATVGTGLLNVTVTAGLVTVTWLAVTNTAVTGREPLRNGVESKDRLWVQVLGVAGQGTGLPTSVAPTLSWRLAGASAELASTTPVAEKVT